MSYLKHRKVTEIGRPGTLVLVTSWVYALFVSQGITMTKPSKAVTWWKPISLLRRSLNPRVRRRRR